MEPAKHFEFCPRCSQRRRDEVGSSPFRCAACGFLYYFNPGAKEPAKGKLALPGGFVDVGERAEEALRREIREEVNLELADLRFLCSQTNSYPYAGVTYPVLDLFFEARALGADSVAALDGVESFEWMDARAVSLDAIAFDSMRNALVLLRQRQPAAAR